MTCPDIRSPEDYQSSGLYFLVVQELSAERSQLGKTSDGDFSGIYRNGFCPSRCFDCFTQLSPEPETASQL
jgi:hypothetical protein